MLLLAKSFLSADSGATAIEYGLLSSLMAVFLIAALQSLGNTMSNEFSEIGNVLK